MRTSKSTAPKTPRPRSDSRRKGLRRVQIWIPDLDAVSLRAEAHRQSLAVATSAAQREDQDFVDAIPTGSPARNEAWGDLDRRRR